MPYELPNVTNDFMQLYGWTNTTTNGMWGISILLSIFVITFGVLRRSTNNEGALLGSMVLTNFSAFIFLSLGLIVGEVLMFTIIGLIVAFLYYQFWG